MIGLLITRIAKARNVMRIRCFYQPVKITARGLSRMPRSITMPP